MSFSAVDEHDYALLAHVRPDGWRNPAPKGAYDLVVIGGGTAGLVCAAGAAGLGARVALVERALLGGDCLTTGCVPSKALIRSARAVREMRAAPAAGISATGMDVDFAAVMRRVRARRAGIAPHDSAARLASLGVDVFFGEAAFDSERSVAVGDVRLRFRRAVIATGTRAAVPPIEGLADVPFLTNETLFSITRQPSTLAILGGGPIGCEMAQAFGLLGTEVTLVESGDRLLSKEDRDAAALITARLARDGVRVLTATRAERVAHDGGRISVRTNTGRVIADALLVATGRAPNVDGLGLDRAGIEAGRAGVTVDDHLRTTNRRVYAAGDICSRYQFTHAADAMARIVIQNALFHLRRRLSAVTIPWCTYTLPEVAQVGVRIDEAEGAGLQTITIPLSDVDRAVVDDEADGFVRVHHERGTIRGATIVAPHAGELIGLVGYAMATGGTLASLSGTVFPYPTISESLRKAGDAFARTRLTPRARKLIGAYLRAFR